MHALKTETTTCKFRQMQTQNTNHKLVHVYPALVIESSSPSKTANFLEGSQELEHFLAHANVAQERTPVVIRVGIAHIAALACRRVVVLMHAPMASPLAHQQPVRLHTQPATRSARTGARPRYAASPSASHVSRSTAPLARPRQYVIS